MNIILILDRIKNKIIRKWEKYVFRKRISCPHSDFTLVGSVTLINTNIRLGHGVVIYPGVMFWGNGSIQIGDHVDIGKDTIIYSSACNGGVSIEEHTVIAAQCYPIDMDHGTHVDKLINEQENSVKAISIGKDCWLGANVTVLKGSVIHDGAIIGAKSLVKGAIPPNTIAVGTPTKILRTRN